jgi:hypothetical protein
LARSFFTRPPHQPIGTLATSSAGIRWRYDLNDNLHLLGYIRRRIENTDEMDRYSWYASILFTF